MKTGVECLSLLLLNFVFVVASFPQNFQYLDIDDPCKLKDGSTGVCKMDKECPYFIELIKKRKWNETVKCGFKGINQIVCCKESNSNDNLKKILCEGNVLPIPDKPVRLSDHILNGVQADAAEFPHIAALGYNAEGPIEYEFNCGGSLISDSYVLTAAHCCNQRGRQPIIVRLGKTSLNSDLDFEDKQDIKVAEVIIHEDYSSRTRLNDIALLKLEKPATLAHNVWPACVSSRSQGVIKNLTIIGFGRISNDNRTKSDWLLKSTVNEIGLEQCKQEFSVIPNGKPLKESQVCANNLITFSDTCEGDSGSPMEYKKNNLHYVYGITSYGLACGSSFPSIYTRVDQYLDWLNEKMDS